MKLEKLLEFLELEDPSEFEYFENLADLMETDMVIEPEIMYQLLETVDMEAMGEMIENYLNEILNALPEDAMEMYQLLDSVRMAFVGMAKHLEEERDLVLFADELTRFRNWYSLYSTVWVREIVEDIPREKEMPLRDALTLVRMEQLGGEKYDYIFEEAMDFEMDQYAVTFADLAQENGGAERDEELEELDLPGIEYTDHIFKPEKLH
ncbi:MAG: hypothetical protein HFE75_03145 [Firmicutes bacterium]|nr:hypothetical protein [Bacillota bacterium]NBI63307.1 hypothetical protein [Clostridiales bacterium]